MEWHYSIMFYTAVEGICHLQEWSCHRKWSSYPTYDHEKKLRLFYKILKLILQIQ